MNGIECLLSFFTLAREKNKVSTEKWNYLLSDRNKKSNSPGTSSSSCPFPGERQRPEETQNKKEGMREGETHLCANPKKVSLLLGRCSHIHLHRQGVGWGVTIPRLTQKDAHKWGAACTTTPCSLHTARASPDMHCEPGEHGKGDRVKWERRGAC